MIDLRGEHNLTTRQILASDGEAFARFVAANVKAFGLPPSGREVAVAHECGHAVVGVALGGQINTLRVFKDRMGWCGLTVANPEDVIREVDPDAEPEVAHKIALCTLAGIAGERVAGVWHRNSSPDEVFKVLCLSIRVAEREGSGQQDYFNRVLAEAEAIIRDRRALFYGLVGLFSDSDEPRWKAVRRLLRRG